MSDDGEYRDMSRRHIGQRALAWTTAATLAAGVTAVVTMDRTAPATTAVSTAPGTSRFTIPDLTTVGEVTTTTFARAVEPPKPTPQVKVPPAPPATAPTLPPVSIPPTTLPPTTIPTPSTCPAGPQPFNPGKRGLYVVDATTARAASLAPGYSIGGASFAPLGDRVVFSGRASGGDHGSEPTTLWIVNVDGTGLHRVAADAEYPGQPAWSPDGRTIGYYSPPYNQASGDAGLYLLDVESGDSRLLAEVDGGGFPMEWSPDGSKIALPAPNNEFVTIVDTEDGEVTQLPASRSVYEVSWSPRGDQLVVSDLEGPVWTVNPDGSQPRIVVPDGRYARWSPVDDRLSVWRGFNAHVHDLRTGADRLLALNADPVGWSHDGRDVHVLVGTRRIEVVNTLTTCASTIAATSTINVSAAEWSPTSHSFLVVAEPTGARRY